MLRSMMPLPQRRIRRLCPTARSVAAIVAALSVAGCGKDEIAKPVALDPNVVLITFDTTRADHFSCYGYNAIRTPTVDSLASRGVRYARCYAPVPITLPSHASIMTGLYPFHHGLRDNGAAPLDDRFTTLAELVTTKGYRTGAFIGAFVLNSRYGLNQGFQTYGDNLSGAARASKLMIPERNAEAVTDAALAWLQQPSTAPYFLWTHYFDPHMPYSPPGLPPGTLNQPAYDQELVYADAQLGRLVSRIEELEKETGRPTLIVFTADHGESLLEHGEPTHAYFVYEATLHVPLVVVLPKQGPRDAARRPATPSATGTFHGVAPGVVDVPVGLVDIFPSILDWLSIPAPYQTPGRPLPVPKVESPENPAPNDPAKSGSRPLYFETRMPFNTYGWSPLEGILVGSRKYIAAPKPELYDLARDPRESLNLYEPDNADALSLQQALRVLKTTKSNIPAPSDGPANTDDASRRALRALGYAGGHETPPEDISSLRDPKDMLVWHVRGAADAELRIDSAHAVESVPVLAEALRADPDNRWVLTLLSELLDRQETFAAVAPMAQERLMSPLPPPHDRRLPASLALALARNDRAQEAVELLTPLVEKMPDSAEFHFALGASQLEARMPVEGMAELRRAVELDPKHRPARILLGDTLFSQAMLRSDSAGAQQGFESAVEHFRAALKSAADLPPPPHIEGAAEHEPRALPLVAPGVSVSQLRVKLAVALERLGQASDALAELRQAVDLDPDLYEARMELAGLLLDTKTTSEAETHYREAARIGPENPEAHYNLGGLYLRTNRPEIAVEHFREAVRLKPDHGPAIINLGISLFRTGKNDEAKAMFERAIEIPTSAAEACHSLGIALSKEGKTAEAIAVFERAVAVDPTYTAPVDEMIGLALREHRTADAVRVLRNAVATFPENVRYLNALAQILATASDDSIRNGTEALDLARRANRLTGDQHPAILATLAAALAETGDFDQATAVAERALAIASRTQSPQPGGSQPASLIDQLRAQLAAFREHKPFRDPRY